MKKLEPVMIAEEIYRAITKLGEEGQRIETDDLIQKKADAMGDYDRQLGVAEATLKIEGEAVSLIEKIAKGRTADLLIKKIVAEETLKAHYSKLERLEAMLNGLQSIFRHLSEIV